VEGGLPSVKTLPGPGKRHTHSREGATDGVTKSGATSKGQTQLSVIVPQNSDDSPTHRTHTFSMYEDERREKKEKESSQKRSLTKSAEIHNNHKPQQTNCVEDDSGF
jgi:hypothetical protein